MCLSMLYDWLKILSDVIKGCGVCCVAYGSLYNELGCLRGRGVAPVDWEAELAKRLQPYAQGDMLAMFGTAELRAAVRNVVNSEMTKKNKIPRL